MPGKNKEAYVKGGGGGSKKRATRKTTATGEQVKGKKPVRKRYPDTIKPATSMTQKVLRSIDAGNRPIFDSISHVTGMKKRPKSPDLGRLSKKTELDKKLAARKRRKK